MLVQNASDMIIVMNETGWVLDANRAALKMLGADTFSEVINHSFEEVAGLNRRSGASSGASHGFRLSESLGEFFRLLFHHCAGEGDGD